MREPHVRPRVAAEDHVTADRDGWQFPGVVRQGGPADGLAVGPGIGDDAIHDAELAACTTAIMKSWRFPASSGGVKRFSYPFIFRSN